VRITRKKLSTYLKDVNEIVDNDPVVIVELVPSQFQRLVGGDFVDSLPICERKAHHVVGRVPSGNNVTGDELLLEVEFRAGAAPRGEGNCGRMDDCE
jgi:hypothetical protein